jgi:hypothetical protein
MMTAVNSALLLVAVGIYPDLRMVVDLSTTRTKAHAPSPSFIEDDPSVYKYIS